MNIISRYAATFMLAAMATVAHADYPTRVVKMVVPYAAGSGVDIAMRPIADAIARQLKAPVVVDNRAGAGGIVGTDAIAKAPPDGYTFGYANLATLAINKSYFRKLPYDPKADLAPIGLAIANPYVIVVRREFPADTFEQLVEYSKANPGKITMGSPGPGSAGHLAGELIQSDKKITWLHVPYKTGTQAVTDMVGGQLDMLLENIVAVLPFIKDARVKTIAVTSARRSTSLPNVPTLEESGMKGFEVVAWGGFVAPKGTPTPILLKINEAVQKSLKDPAVIRAYDGLSVDSNPSTAEEFSTLIDKEIPRWASAVQRAGVKGD